MKTAEFGQNSLTNNTTAENDIITVSSDESRDESEDVNSIITMSTDKSVLVSHENEHENDIITVSSDESEDENSNGCTCSKCTEDNAAIIVSSESEDESEGQL